MTKLLKMQWRNLYAAEYSMYIILKKINIICKLYTIYIDMIEGT